MRAVCEEEIIDIQNAEDQARIRSQMDRILAHNSFRNSKRYQAFLRYVVDESLNGNAVYLKERMIGISVFQQPLDYDTNMNSVVRVTAGEVRRRLAQYYLNASLADEVLIELPLGSYIPEFRANDTSVAPETALITPEVEPSYGAEELLHRTVQIMVEPTIQPKERLSRGTWVAIIACCVLLAAAVSSIALSPSVREISGADRVWKGAFNGKEVLLCAGPQAAERSGPQQYSNSISFTIAKTIGIIGSAIGHSGGNTFLVPMQETKLEDLQRSPAVLIGAFNNEWTMRLQSPLRYQFFSTPENFRGIHDTQNPTAKRFMVGDQPMRDYGVLAHFHSPTTGQSTVIIGGLCMQGTAAVRIFLSSPDVLREFSKSAPRGWEKGSYEIVLASDQVNKLADSPKVVAAYFW